MAAPTAPAHRSRTSGRHAADAPRARRIWPAMLVVALSAALALTGAALMLDLPSEGRAHAVSARDLRGELVAFETPPPAGTVATTIPGARFIVPDVGLDVALSRVSVDGSEVVPPGFTDAYLLDGVGVSPQHAAAGTVFVVMHSIRGGGVGPGDYLMDAAGSSALTPGATIRVDGVDYRVTASDTRAKLELAADTELWSSVPGRLVVITCQQSPDGSPSTRNLVIEARMDT